MAIRLSHFLGTTLESWLNMQQALDIWDLPHKNARIYQQIETEAS
jgi:plasmid maintenance system antidote protein VapI